MNSSRLLTCLLMAALGPFAHANPTSPPAPAKPTAPVSLGDAFTLGKFSANLRLRYEGVEQTGLQDADALTLRTRLGYTTALWRGWKFMVDAENITAADGDSYNQAGLNPGGAGKAVIADPEITEINQTWLAFTHAQTTATLGRQRLVLDNARFVGDVAWRQNMQTFDALVLTDKTITKTTLTYAYLEQINRVFGEEHAQGKGQSDSHVFNASYTGFAAGTLTGYAYLLDFRDTSPVNSNATYGLSFAGTSKLSDTVKFAYRAEYAQQSDYGSSTLRYDTDYYVFEAGLAHKQGSLTLGYEVLGSDNKVGFKTPLATLHAFNGWADLFLATPAAGLRDTYLKATANLPADIGLVAFYHQFEADSASTTYGTEFDLQLSRKFGKRFTALLKYADFSRDSLTFPDVRKFWAQVEFVY